MVGAAGRAAKEHGSTARSCRHTACVVAVDVQAKRRRVDRFTRRVYREDAAVIRRVEITDAAEKQLRRLPRYIVVKLAIWVAAVELDGLEETRKVPGYHDEPLKGERAGQRSIRLSRSYRAVYAIKKSVGEFVSVEEVHKHRY